MRSFCIDTYDPATWSKLVTLLLQGKPLCGVCYVCDEATPAI